MPDGGGVFFLEEFGNPIGTDLSESIRVK